MFSFSRRKSLVEKIETEIQAELKPSILARLRDKLFHRSERSRIKRILVYASLIFVVISVAAGVAYYLDLRQFALTHQGFPRSPFTLDQSELSTSLLEVYNQHTTPETKFGIVFIVLVLISFALLELTVVWTLLRSWMWQLRPLLGRIAFALLAQIALIIPLSVIVIVPEYVVGNLTQIAEMEVSETVGAITKSDKSTGNVYETAEIVAHLEESAELPTLATGPFFTSVLTQSFPSNDQDTFYLTRLIPTTLVSTEAQELGHQAMLVRGRHLVVDPSLPKDQLQSLLTALSERTLKDSLIAKQIDSKPVPKISFLDSPDYVQIETKKRQEKERQITTHIAGLEKDRAANLTFIVQATKYLDGLRSDKTSYESRVRPIERSCLEQYSQDECQEVVSTITSNLSEYDQEIGLASANLSTAQSYIPLYDQALSSSRNTLAKFQDYPVIPEYQVGVFEPPSEIMVKYLGSERGSSDYYYTLLHELAHYYSHNQTRVLPSFLEEGMTDYLSIELGQKVVSSENKVDGYPDELKITRRLEEMLGSEKLVELYFSKSTASLTTLLAPHCSKTCYRDLGKIGEQLTFADLDDTALRSNLTGQALAILDGGEVAP